jgi:hypothetical protein
MALAAGFEGKHFAETVQRVRPLFDALVTRSSTGRGCLERLIRPGVNVNESRA